MLYTVATQATLRAECDHIPRWVSCKCGVHIYPRLRDLFGHEFFRLFLTPELIDPDGLDELLRPVWEHRQGFRFALTLGAVLGRCWPDPIHPEARRAQGYRIGTVLTPEAGQASALAGRYGCEVATDMSYRACRALADRLVGSVSAAALAELADRPAVPPISRGRLGGNIDRRPFAGCDPVRLAGLAARDPAVRKALLRG